MHVFFFAGVGRFEVCVAGVDGCFLCVSVDSGTSLEVESPVAFSVCSGLRSDVSVIASKYGKINKYIRVCMCVCV